MQMVRGWARASRLGVCKVSTGVCDNEGNAGVGQCVSVHTETDCCLGGKVLLFTAPEP